MPLLLVLMTAPEAPTSRSMTVPLGNKPVMESDKGPSKYWLRKLFGPLLYNAITTVALLELDTASKYHLGVFSWYCDEFNVNTHHSKVDSLAAPANLGPSKYVSRPAVNSAVTGPVARSLEMLMASWAWAPMSIAHPVSKNVIIVKIGCGL